MIQRSLLRMSQQMTAVIVDLPLQPSSSEPSTTIFASLSLHGQDRIRLLQFPDDIVSDIRHIISSAWSFGITSSGPYGEEAYQYVLKGRPFEGHHFLTSHEKTEAVQARRLIRDILAFLYSRSWQLVCPFNGSIHASAKDELIFRRLSPSNEAPPPPPPVEWLALGFLSDSRIRVIYDVEKSIDGGVDDNTCRDAADLDYIGTVIATMRDMFQSLDMFEKGEWDNDCFEFRLKHRPFLQRGVEGNKVRLMNSRLVELLDGLGWKSHATICQNSGGDECGMMDTWYFVKEKGSGVR